MLLCGETAPHTATQATRLTALTTASLISVKVKCVYAAIYLNPVTFVWIRTSILDV